MPASDIPANISPTANADRGGLNLSFGANERCQTMTASPSWQLAGWSLQFVQLPPGAELAIAASTETTFAKVITGSLKAPHRGAYAEPFTVRSTQVEGTLQAGDQGALIALFVQTAAPTALTDMQQIVFSGPQAESLPFVHFHERFHAVTDYFRDADAYMTPGIHLLDEAGAEICNVIFWTAGKGVGLSTHDHGREPSALAPAFAEVHWVMANGTGNGGMYLCDAQDAEPKARFPMQQGEEHGPFFHIDEQAKRPRLRANGAVDYPWHGWQGGTDEAPGQAYDLVCAFEITAPYADLAATAV